ncbi:MAG: hypothetical protein ACODAQ_11500 [Phycisphaeraceae bacterium]
MLIITFRDDSEVAADNLQNWDVAYHELICWLMQESDLADVDVWKATVYREHGVKVLFEDDRDVLADVDAATVCFMPFDPAARVAR